MLSPFEVLLFDVYKVVLNDERFVLRDLYLSKHRNGSWGTYGNQNIHWRERSHVHQNKVIPIDHTDASEYQINEDNTSFRFVSLGWLVPVIFETQLNWLVTDDFDMNHE